MEAGTHWNARSQILLDAIWQNTIGSEIVPEDPPAPPPLLPPAPVGMSTQTWAQLLPSVPSATVEQACVLMSEKHWVFAVASTCFPMQPGSHSCPSPAAHVDSDGPQAL